jgi:hypothetical protein
MILSSTSGEFRFSELLHILQPKLSQALLDWLYKSSVVTWLGPTPWLQLTRLLQPLARCLCILLLVYAAESNAFAVVLIHSS